MRLKQTKVIQSNFSTQCDDWYIFGVIGLEIAKNASNHAVFFEKCNENEVFRQSQTHILRCASFCVFARLQLRHICIYKRHIGFAYRINRFGHMPDSVLPR